MAEASVCIEDCRDWTVWLFIKRRQHALLPDEEHRHFGAIFALIPGLVRGEVGDVEAQVLQLGPPQLLHFITVHVQSVDATRIGKGLELEEPLVVPMPARASRHGAIPRHFDLLNQLSWRVKIVDLHFLGGILKVIDQHNGAILH